MNNTNKQSPYIKLKIQRPCRSQVEMNFFSLEDRIASDHKARAVWDFVEQMDISILYEMVNSYQGEVGRKAVDPKVLFALWLYGITEGTFSARKIERECSENDAYRWIAGGIEVNRNNLSAFRSEHSSSFHKLLTESLAVMVRNNLLYQEDFSQDGTRIKANAGFNTFRSESSIEEVKNSIYQRIKEIEEAEKKTADYAEKTKLKREKEHAERRLNKAKQAAEELKKHKASLTENAKKNHESKAVLQKRLDRSRASLVDPEARKMKMGDGGFRIGFNVQFATSVESRTIFGVNVVNTPDPGTLTPMISQVNQRLKRLGMKLPENWIGDSAYSYKDDLNSAHNLFPDLNIVASPHLELKEAKKEKKTDLDGVRKWRKLIDTEEFKRVYSKRCSTAEFSNMLTKAQGMGKTLLRGIQKVTSMCLLYAIAFNMTRYWNL